jgi:hypothetical protein
MSTKQQTSIFDVKIATAACNVFNRTLSLGFAMKVMKIVNNLEIFTDETTECAIIFCILPNPITTIFSEFDSRANKNGNKTSSAEQTASTYPDPSCPYFSSKTLNLTEARSMASFTFAYLLLLTSTPKARMSGCNTPRRPGLRSSMTRQAKSYNVLQLTKLRYSWFGEAETITESKTYY